MWQSSISTESIDGCVMERIGSKMLPVVNGVGGIIVQDTISDRVRLSIAVHDRYADRIKSELENAVTEEIGTYYKRKFISDSVKLPILSESLQKAFIQALVSFDKLFETELIRTELPESEVLSLDGFLRFRCEELKSRWEEICALAMQSSSNVMNESVCVELIRFLLSTMEDRCELAVVDDAAPCTLTLRMEKGADETLECEVNDVLAKLVEYCPHKVVVGDDFSDCNVKRLIEQIFK